MGRMVIYSAKALFSMIFMLMTSSLAMSQANSSDKNVSKHFLILVTSDNEQLVEDSLKYIERNWEDSYEIMLIESLYFSLRREVAEDYLRLLQKKTGQQFGLDMHGWYEWIWNKPASYGSSYFDFKSGLHSLIDPLFGTYFSGRENETTIRLDEVLWGGVKQDGIPPLRNPDMINADEATYLDDSNIVFGIEINGDARAYPKRILAWHEMFTDRVGDIPVAGVYCTLCGTFILYETLSDKTEYQLGTSGFLYRSNKLMYDKATQSLWSTLEGEPVIGPLANKGIRLVYQSVVTTSWGEWKSRHPGTKVLSLNTGYSRDYGEGVAYKAYFATDDLMFQVPETDGRIKNKDEILAIRISDQSEKSLAISTKFLKENTLYETELDGVKMTIFTDHSGAHRVYRTAGHHFIKYDGRSTAEDNNGHKWTLFENSLNLPSGTKLERIHSYNAFWFGFHAAFPDTELIGH